MGKVGSMYVCVILFFWGGADYRYRYVLCIYVYIIHVCRHCSFGTNFINFSSLGGSGVADYYGHGFIEDVDRTMCCLFLVWTVAAKTVVSVASFFPHMYRLQRGAQCWKIRTWEWHTGTGDPERGKDHKFLGFMSNFGTGWLSMTTAMPVRCWHLLRHSHGRVVCGRGDHRPGTRRHGESEV